MRKPKKKPKVLNLTSQEAEELLKRAETNSLTEKDCEIISGMVNALRLLNNALIEKDVSIKRLLKMLFGIKTEKTKDILEPADASGGSENTPEDKEQNTSDNNKETPKGHGRNGESAYTGAERIKIPHPILKSGDPCPSCVKGRVYLMIEVSVVVRITGQPPMRASVYELERFRCNLCLEIFTAPPPAEVGSKKYDETAGAMIVLLRYGAGFPLYRFEKFQECLGVPIPDATQWDITEGVANQAHPAYREIVRYGAQGNIIHHDDTPMKVLALIKENHGKDSGTGIFTTGFVSIVGERKIGLFFTGRKHAGENMALLLEQREKDRERPIQMCDALSRNMPKELETIIANCLSHARRNFVEIIDNFPQECRFVILIFKDVYKNDDTAKEEKMSDEERLAFHKAESGPLMEKLHTWCGQQFTDKTVEPNSDLGRAIKYLLNHWEKLTLFLRVPGAPLDNNICERTLKQAILHRKNSLFYKTENGAYIGDMFMSIIYTCKLAEVNPFEYLVALQKYASEVFKNPQNWLPWNYKTAKDALVTPENNEIKTEKQDTDPPAVAR